MVRLIELKFEKRIIWFGRSYYDLVDQRIVAVDPQMVSVIADVGHKYGYDGDVCMLLIAASRNMLVAGSLDVIQKALRP